MRLLKTYRYFPYFLMLASFPLLATEIFVEAKGAYFYSTSPTFRNIYGGSGLSGIDVTYSGWKQIYPWVGLNLLYASGHSIGLLEPTQLYAIPMELGLKCLFFRGPLIPYLGGGLLGAWAHIHNATCFANSHQEGWGIGGIGKFGSYIFLYDRLFLDIFLNYYWLKIQVNRGGRCVLIRSGDLSGLVIGSGLGYCF